MSNNLGLNYIPLVLSNEILTSSIKLRDATIITDVGDTNTYNLSNFGGNTATYDNINILGNGIIGGNLDVSGNLKVDVAIEAPIIVVPVASVQVLNAQNADLREITSNNITNSNLIYSTRLQSNIGNIFNINATNINSSQINNSGNIFANGVDINGLLTIRNPSNSADYLQINPQFDSVYIGGSNIVLDGQTNNNTITIDGFSRVNINDPTFLNQTTTTGENINANSITLNNFTPSITSNKIYNLSGKLYFNGQPLETGNISGNYVPIIQQVSNDISKYQTSLSYYLDFTPIGGNQTLFYYNIKPYPSFSDLPSLLYLSNAGNSSTHLQLYDTASQRRVGYIDGHFTTIINDSTHRIGIYFSEKANPQFNIYNGSGLVSHIDIEPDETIIFVYQQSFSHYFIASRTVNFEAFNIKLNNFSSIGTFSGSTITATNTTSTNLTATNITSTNANISNNLRVSNIIAFTQPNINIQGDLIFPNGNKILANAQPSSDDMLTNKRYVDSRHGGGNILENNNTWLGTQNYKQNIRLSDSRNLTLYNSAENQYLQLNIGIAYTQNPNGTGYILDGQNNTGDFIIQNYGHLRSVQPVKTNSITPIGGTLTVGGDNGLSTLNLATSDTTQTINLGTGIGTTTINIGQPGDTINLNGNVSYTQVNDLAISDKDIYLNSNSVGSGTARGAGIFIRDNNSNIAGKIIVNSLGTGYNLKAPEDAREVNFDLPNFNNGLLKVSSNVITSSAGAISDITGLQTALDGKASITGQTFSGAIAVQYGGKYTLIQNSTIFTDQSNPFTIDGQTTSGNIIITRYNNAVFNQPISMGSNKITSSYSAVNSVDIPNKLYVDNAIANASSFGNITASGLNSSGQIVAQATADAIKLMPTATAHQFISFLDPPNSRYCYIGRPTNGSPYFDIGCQDQASTILRLTSGNGGANNIEIVSPISMGSNKITSSYTAVNNVDIPNKSYVDNQIANANVFNNSSFRSGNFAVDILNNSNPALRDAINYPNALSLGNNNSFAWLQSWNSRPLKINSLGNSVHFGDGGAPVSVQIYGGALTIYNANNLNQYLQINGSGLLYSGTQDITLDGQTSTSVISFKNFNRVQVEDQLRLTDTNEALQFRRPSNNSATYMTFRENSGVAQYCYFGVESSSGGGIFGGTPNQVSFGTTTTNRIAFFQNNTRGSYLDSDNGYVYQYNRDGAPYKTWDNQISTPAGKARIRFFETTTSGAFSRSYSTSGTVLIQQPNIGHLSLGSVYGLSNGSAKGIQCISAHYTGLSAGLYCAEITMDDNGYGLINNFPFSISSFGTYSYPIYIYGGDCYLELTNLNFSGNGECFFRLDLVYATTY